MKIFGTLREKPWLHETALAAGQPAPIKDALGPARIALRFVMAVVAVLFSLFIITYLSRSQYPDFQALAGLPWQPFTDPGRLWFNTGLLAVSSVALQIGVMTTRRGNTSGTVGSISVAMLFAIAFLLAQLDLWNRLYFMGFYVSTNPANSYFYLLTAVHGLHLLGGMIVLVNIVFRMWYDKSLTGLSGALGLCSQYWHFMLLVWLVLFALLTASSETINALAAMCGF